MEHQLRPIQHQILANNGKKLLFDRRAKFCKEFLANDDNSLGFVKEKSRAKSPLSNLGCWLAAKASATSKQAPLLASSDTHMQNAQKLHSNAIKLSSRLHQQQQQQLQLQFGWPNRANGHDLPARPATPRLFGLQLAPPCQCSHCRTVQQLVEVDAQMRINAKSRHKNANHHPRQQPQANFLYL